MQHIFDFSPFFNNKRSSSEENIKEGGTKNDTRCRKKENQKKSDQFQFKKCSNSKVERDQGETTKN